MTVDSAYYPVVFANDGEVEYLVELESIGGVFQVYKVPDNGTARTLLVEDEHYTVKYEEHLDPIKKRALITLAAPIASDAHLEVFRSTTIETDFLAEALKPLPSEQFEHTLDRICFIQQEIEGHLCGCAGGTDPGMPTYPPDPDDIPDLPSECLPYDCNAFVEYALANGYNAIDFGDSNTPGDTLPAEFSFGSEPQTVYPEPAYVGTVLTTSDTQRYYLWPVSTSEFDRCSDKEYALGLNDETVWVRTGPKLWMPRANPAVAFMHKGGISSAFQAAAIVRRRYRTTIPGWANGGKEKYLALAWDNGTGFEILRYGPASVPVGKPAFNSGANFLSCEFTMTPYLYQPTEGVDFWYIAADVKALIRSNDTVYEVTYREACSSAGTFATFNGWTFEEIQDAGFFQDARAKLFAVATREEGYDADALYNFYKQNFAGYQPPGTCPTQEVGAGEPVSSIPPVQGIFD